MSASPWCHLPSPAFLKGERTQLLITPGCCTSHTGISKRPRIRELLCFAIAGKNREASKGQDCFPERIRCRFRAVGAALGFAVSSNPSAQPWDGRARQPRHHIPGLLLKAQKPRVSNSPEPKEFLKTESDFSACSLGFRTSLLRIFNHKSLETSCFNRREHL